MRLEKIRLTGFKSFVDSTTVHFPSNLCGVVGPNGCGKSNLIDAVRWVMGESSARMLRGDAMSDVIFNGSSTRKPLTSASVELVFDNRDGRAGGAYAAFAQIAVKREVARDGQAGYFLNGTRCRRRDIQDLFLGTGLGPRSYAIIEQGMIARIIEARPEELRLFVEEAAGISKFKERRRETEQHLSHTRDNLARLDDVRDEVSKQLQHLERQASHAEKYTQLRQEETQLELELTALRWRTLNDDIQAHERQLVAAHTVAEVAVADQQRVDSALATQRDAHQLAIAAANDVQTQVHACNADIAQLEQAITFAGELRQRQESEFLQLQQSLDDIAAHLQQEHNRSTERTAALIDDEAAWQHAEQQVQNAMTAVAAAEVQLRAWETDWESFDRRAAQPAAQAQSERTQLTALEQRLTRNQERLQRLITERTRLQADDVSAQLAELRTDVADDDAQRNALEAAHQRHCDAVAQYDTLLQQQLQSLDHLRCGLQESKGRLAALTALQDAALAAQDHERNDWLAAAGLARAPILINDLQVNDGWALATELALGEALRAVAVTDLSRYGKSNANLPSGLVLIDTSASEDVSASFDALTAQMHTHWPLMHLLGAVRVAENLPEALERRSQLAIGERFITRDGVQVGSNWLATPVAATGRGALERMEAIHTLRQMIADGVAWESKLNAEIAELRRNRAIADQARVAMEQQRLVLTQELAQRQAQLSNSEMRHAHQQERLQMLTAESTELEQQIAEVRTEIEESREQLYDLLDVVDTLAERRAELLAQRDHRRELLALARADEQQCREQSQTLRLRIEGNRAAQAATLLSVRRAEEQQTQHRERRAALQLALANDLEPLNAQRQQLEQQRQSQVTLAETLVAACQRRDELDAAVHTLELERQRLAQAVALNQQQLETLRLAQQERLVRAQTLEEQLTELGTTANAVLATVNAKPVDSAAADVDDETRWREALARVRARIQRLGAINLAAIDEFKELAERKAYLDAQHADIAGALEALEQAIRKIDRETRSRFKDTFERVNHEFQELFPKLFGGGQAYLELTEADVLEAGVRVMARPPGKRNATIHLLSGGEKALTAVALVFAIFQLNPAPFCLLDEVDAPLDDANVVRFCDLLQSLAPQVQFIFISHNKVTMESADHLLGVTMHEPGVSRLVAVDVAAAVALCD
ncbi:chromosome segregation protein SMC [Chromatium weissei]|nr:chromosome segregation protein SMC [Chromatium weissei]